MKRLLLVVLFINIFRNGETFEENSVFEKIKSGLEIAGQILGLDKAKGVAELVSEAFGNRRPKKEDNGDNGSTIFSSFLRVLGLDTKRIGAIAVNAIIFVAQLISTSLSTPPPAYLTQAKSLPEENPLNWLLTNPQVQQILPHAKESNLPHEIIEDLKNYSISAETNCLQLLVCKSAPFIWSMQRAVNAEKIKTGKDALTGYIPNMDEVADNGDECELKFPQCIIEY